MSDSTYQIVCYLCGGRGKYQETGVETCPDCAGTGYDKNSELFSPCNGCNGSGQRTYCRWITCTMCGGSGYLPY